MSEIKVESGKKREFSTGAKKQAAAGKGTPVLIPGDAMLDVAKHFEAGATVHGARNWEKGIPLSELLNSLERHLQQEKMGMLDEPHARALAWNAIVYLATKLRIETGQLPFELADMPGCYGSAISLEELTKELELDKPEPQPQFKAGDKVRIKLRKEDSHLPVAAILRESKYIGIYVRMYNAHNKEVQNLHSITLNDETNRCFFTDELTLMEDN